MPDTDALDVLRTATQRLVRGVDRLPDEAWAEPSLLPGWSRAHVVAHLALNAEGLAGSIAGARAGHRVPMYSSSPERDAAISDLARTSPSRLRERLLGSTTSIADALVDLPPEVAGRSVERAPGEHTFPVAAIAEMRLREVEIHHADLDVGYSSADWSPGFAVLVLDAMAARAVPLTDAVLVLDVRPDEPAGTGRRWVLGAGGPVVRGPAHALAWWATGRPAGPELTSESGVLPRIETW